MPTHLRSVDPHGLAPEPADRREGPEPLAGRGATPHPDDRLSLGPIAERSIDNPSDSVPAPDGDAIAIMAYLATDAGKKSGRKPSRELVQAIASSWPDQADRILALVEDTLFSAPYISATVVDAVSDRIDPSDFMRLTGRHRVARCLFAYVRPNLLAPGQAQELGDDEIDRRVNAVGKQWSSG